MRSCAVCAFLDLQPNPSSGEVGVWTTLPEIVAAANHMFPSAPAGEQHVMLTVCSEHVVDIYRDRVPGLRMAWRVRVEPAAPALR